MQRRLAVLIILGFSFAGAAKGYGPAGHEIVGGIADERLANTPAGKKVQQLIDGFTLEKAAVIADEIKGWDKKGADDPTIFHYSRRPQIDAQLRDFWKANPPTKDPTSAVPSHHWFHYTDVPLVRLEKYEDGKAGRSQWDVVHMIGYCADVLRGRVSETNDRKITRPIAVILLAHYVGDIHQPLHVGAEYFDKSGKVADPDKDPSALADEGGNSLTLELNDDAPRGRGNHKKKFHGFWDMDTVNSLLPVVPDTTPKEERRSIMREAQAKLEHEMATQEPANWNMPADMDVNRYAQAWANEILPLAREAHERIGFKQVALFDDAGHVVAAGEVEEKPGDQPGEYRNWADGVVREELHKAGWRLADLLEKCLSSAPAAPTK
jgi:hypothetical protein